MACMGGSSATAFVIVAVRGGSPSVANAWLRSVQSDGSSKAGTGGVWSAIIGTAFGIDGKVVRGQHSIPSVSSCEAARAEHRTRPRQLGRGGPLARGKQQRP